MPAFAEPASAPGATAERPRPMASVEIPRRSFPPRPAPLSAPFPRAQAAPPAATGWKSPRRAEKVGNARPPFRPSRGFSPADGRKAGVARTDPRGGARPENRQNAPLGAQKGSQTGAKNERGPAPWKRTGQASRSAPRPASTGGRGNFPYRPGASPAHAPGSRPQAEDRLPAKARPEKRQGAPSGPQKRPQTGANNERRPAPWKRTGPASRSTSRPAPAGAGGNFRRPGASPVRPPGFPPPATGQRPSKARWVPGGARPAASFRPKEGRSSNPGAGPKRHYDRPRAAGEQKSAASPAFPRDDKKPRPRFAPGSRPPGSWPRTSSGKPQGKRGKPPGKKPRV